MRVAGVMSGTSLDGIDVAIVDIGRRKIEPVAWTSTAYSPGTRAAILAVSNTHTHTAEISRLNVALGELYAKAVTRAARRAAISMDSIDLIGCHGQTIFHEGWNTFQIGEAAVIAERTGIAVVSNFRARDIAAGGQGAPLVPYFDFRMFRHATRRRAVLNIGGIANVTILPAGAELKDLRAFDTGPGNMVSDQLMAEHTQGKSTYDRNGQVAESGAPVLYLLEELLADPYYRRSAPKTAGREQYGPDFVARFHRYGAAFPDLVTTAALLTAKTIALGVGEEEGDLIVSGGGIHNRFLMAHLHALLPHMRIATTADYGIDPDAKEAIAFALLAYETWYGHPSNVPGATGAKHAVILGDITPGTSNAIRSSRRIS